MKVLVVEDQKRLAGAVAEGLRREGMAVDISLDGRDALAHVALNRYDVVVLDRDLPGVHGDQVCRAILAEHSEVRVLMLTAASTLADRVDGLELGADDYLPKPFNPRELIARIQAILRRHGGAPSPASEDQVIHFGNYVLNLSQRTLKRDDEEVGLTNGEFELLSTLANRANHPLSREQLIELSNNRDSDAFDRSIDVRISRLRRLIEPDPSKPRYIQTVWGFGYKFVP